MNIQEILNISEDEHVEFKEAKNHYDFDELTKYACALANRGGGWIFLGITDRRPRQVVGTNAFLQPERQRNSLIERLHIQVQFKELRSEKGLKVQAFKISSRPLGLPVQYKGIAYWRIGESLQPMPENVRKDIYAESGHDFSADICIGASINDLDTNAIENFRTNWFKKSSLMRLQNLSHEQLLRDCDAVTDEGITYAALILFGKKQALTKYLAQSEFVFEYRSSIASGPAQQREDLRDAFFNIYDQLWNLINLRNSRQHYQDGLFIFDIATFNERATREVLLNAVCHRNYQYCGSIFVVQYPDCLVVKSPGGFLPGISPENILDKQAPRNRRIAEILARCGLVERSGQGMNLIFETSIKEAKALPDFHGTDDNEVCITLHGLVLDKNMLLLINKIGSETLDSFSTQDFLVLNYLYRDEKLPATLKNNTKHLLDLGLIERISKGKYILSRRYYTAAGKSGEHTRRVGLDRETNKILLLTHIQRQKAAGTQLRELQQVLPSLPTHQIQSLLRDLKKAGKIYSTGNTKGARWYCITEKNEE